MKTKRDEEIRFSDLVPELRQALKISATCVTKSESLPAFSEMMTAITVVVTRLMVSGTPSALV